MAKNQKHYTLEFKQQIVDLYNAGGKSMPQLQGKYGVNKSNIYIYIQSSTYYKALVSVPSKREIEYEQFSQK